MYRQPIASLTQAASEVSVDRETATAVARREFPSLPAPVTRLAVPHTGPFLLGVPDRSEIAE